MAHKKHKIIALATSGVALSSALLAATAVISSNAIANARKAQAQRASLHIAADSDFKWSADRLTIEGFKTNITTAEIQALIVDNKLTLPECQYIAKGAFDFAFENITTSFELVLHKNVKEIGESAFMGNSMITAVSYHDGTTATTSTSLKNIGTCAFEKTGLTSFNIPNGCIIGERAFYKCSDLAEINLGSRKSLYTDIGSHAFQGVSATGVLTANSMSDETANAMASNFETTAWGGLEFASTAATGKWTIAPTSGSTPRTRTNTVPTIYLDIDSDTKELKPGLKRGSLSSYDTLYVPSEVKSLGNNAFADCTTLKTLTFADNSECKSIGNNCFTGCTNLAGKLTLPDSLTSIGRQAFYNCANITELDMSKIYFGGASRSFAVGTEAFYGWDETTTHTVTYPTRESGATSMTADQIKTIFATAMSTTGSLNDKWIDSGREEATSAEYVAATTTIAVPVEGDEGYEYQITQFDCSALVAQGLNTIVFQPQDDGSDQTIVSNLFYEDGESTLPASITTIDMSKSNIKDIGENSFRESQITTVVLSDSTETIGANCFQDCTNLTGVGIPSSIKTIGARAFAGCNNAYYLDLSKLSESDLTALITQQAAATTEEEKPIGYASFDGYGKLCPNGGTILWADDVSQEVKDAFASILINYGLLPENWYRDTIDTEGVVGGIPVSYDDNGTTKTILVIDDNHVLTTINWANLESYIDYLKAQQGSEVTSLPLIIPRTVLSIADDFWSSISGKTSTTEAIINKLYFAVGSKCTTIGARAFAGATNFTGHLTLGSDVTTIGDSAFEGCSGFDDTLVLPSSLSTTQTSIGAEAFKDCSGIKTLDVSEWDNSYIETWTSSVHPIGDAAFDGWSTSAVLIPYAGISTTNLKTLQEKLDNPGLFPSDQFGQDATTYDTTQHGQLDTSEFETEAKLRLVDTQENKDALAEKYIEIINSDSVELQKGSSTETISGVEILKHDLMTTFAQAARDVPGLGIKNPVVNVNISNISIKGDRIGFDVVANTNIYSSIYEFGLATQFSTSVKNLHITSTGAYERTKKEIASKQIGIEFEIDTDTEFYTEYDKEYMYTTDDSGNYVESTLVDVTNKSFSWRELASEFDKDVWYDAESAAGIKMHTLARQAYSAAPGLFSELFGVYDNSNLANLSSGRDDNGMLYTPYITSGKDTSDKLIYKYTPLKGKFASPTFGEFSAYDLADQDDYNVGPGWINYAWNYVNNTNQLSTQTMSSDAALEALKTWYKNGETTYGATLASGRLLKEEFNYSVCSATQTYITQFLSTGNYTRVEENDSHVYQLKEKGASGALIDVLTTDTEGNIYATFGLDINLSIHDDNLVIDGNPPSGETKITGFKHSFEIHLPLEFHNVKLFSITQTTKNKLSCWSIADNRESGTDTSWMRIGGEGSGGMSAYLRTLVYDDSEGVEKFTTAYTLGDKDGDYTYEKINQDLRDAGYTTVAEVEEYLEENWPLLYNLNFLSAQRDSSSRLYVALNISSWYLMNIILS